MQIIYKCNECYSENVEVVSSKFDEKIKNIQGEDYNYKSCKVLFICNDCGKCGCDEFISLNKIKSQFINIVN